MEISNLQGGADNNVEKPISSAFRKCVRGVFESGWLALYEKKLNEYIKERKNVY